jgi:hypothetical protein
MCNVLLIYMSGVNYYQKIVLLYLIIQCVEIKSFSSGSRETPKLFVCDFFLNLLQSESSLLLHNRLDLLFVECHRRAEEEFK